MLNIRKNADGLPNPPALGPSSGSPQPNGSWTAGSRTGERSGGPSLIGADLTIIGNLISRGEVQVEGEIQGDIHATHVVVGENARITGGIVSDEVIVRGHVLGSIRSKRVNLQATSHVEGDVYHQALSIEQGAFFEGKSRRSNDPTEGIQKPEIPEFGARQGNL